LIIFNFLVSCLTQECLTNKPNILVDEISSGNSSLSSSPSIISFSEKSNEIGPESKFNKSTGETSLNRSKSLIDTNSTSTTRLRHVKKRSLTSNDPIFKEILNNETINRSSKSININDNNIAQTSSSNNHKHQETFNLCSKCNCEQSNNVNNKTKKSKSKYFIDTDIFLKFFFIM
jgi:hypothetical protein